MNNFEEEIRVLLNQAKEELNKVDEDLSKLQERKSTLTREISGFETTLEVILRRSGQQPEIKENRVESLKNMTHKNKLIELARRNGGSLRTKDATTFLFDNGLIKSKKRANAYIVVQSYLTEMAQEGEIFKQTAPGEYRLVLAQNP